MWVYFKWDHLLGFNLNNCKWIVLFCPFPIFFWLIVLSLKPFFFNCVLLLFFTYLFLSSSSSCLLCCFLRIFSFVWCFPFFIFLLFPFFHFWPHSSYGHTNHYLPLNQKNEEDLTHNKCKVELLRLRHNLKMS